MTNIQNNKRIANNTVILYLRQLLTLAISLYTVRVVLKTLGVIDYGIYNVVGGIVMMFAFISSTMGAASQRFLSFELGKRNYEQLKHIFSLTVLSYIFIAILIFVLSETIGLWFFYNKMNIPNSRMDAAFWVYQFSIFSFIFTIIAIPYNAVIIAREKMNVYAYLSILDSILKLLIIYLLVFISFDKLKLYAVLMFIIYACDFIFYFVYCRFKFEECSYNFIWDWNKLKEMLLYAWWGMIGAIANVFKNQGSNILLNIFFGPAVNASRGISFQIKNAIMNFNNNFFMAVRPAIVKEYAAGNQDEMIKLIYRSTKISYFLMLGLSMPVLIETHFILKFWLGQLPEYVVIFTRLVIIDSLFDTLVLPIAAGVQAKGDVRNYQILVSGFALLNLPASYILLKIGFPPQSTLWIAIILSFICYILRLWMIQKLLKIPIKAYLSNIFLILIFCTLLCLPFPLFIHNYMNESLIRMVFTSLSIISSLIFSFIYFGLTKNEKIYLFSALNKRIKLAYQKIS